MDFLKTYGAQGEESQVAGWSSPGAASLSQVISTRGGSIPAVPV